LEGVIIIPLEFIFMERDRINVLMPVQYPLEQVSGVVRWAVESKPWIERKTGGRVILTFPKKKTDHKSLLPQDYHFSGKVRFSFQHHDTRYQSSGWVSPKEVKDIYSLYNPDIIHIQEPLAGLGLGATGIILGVPRTKNGDIVPSLIGHVHMTKDNIELFTRLLIRCIKAIGYYPWIMKQLDRTLAVSIPTAQCWSQFWPVDYDIVPNGINTEVYTPEGRIIEEWREDPKKKTILFLGRHDRRKNPDGLLRDYFEIRKVRDDVQLKLGGRGFMTPELKRMVDKWGIPDVEFLDILSEEMLPMAYRTADVFGGVYSKDGEAFNRTGGEAFSCGTMAPVSKIKGHMHAFGDVKSAVFFDPDDQTSSVRALMTILDLSEEDRRKLGRQGREHIVNNYSWDIVSERLVRNVYQEVVRKKRDKLVSSGTVFERK